MSARDIRLEQQRGVEFPEGFGSNNSGVVPKLKQITVTEDGNEQPVRQFSPLVVTRLGGTLPWDTQSKQLQCGQTVTETSGDMNIRLVYGCICTHQQFKTLQRMRTSPDDIKLVSRAYSGKASFDELRFDRIPDANGAVLRGGKETTQPLYEIQLQSKEQNQS